MLFHAIPQICLISPVIVSTKMPPGLRVVFTSLDWIVFQTIGSQRFHEITTLRDSVDVPVLAILQSGWWFGTWLLFFHILGIIIPTDELIFFRGVGIAPTSNIVHAFV